MLAPATPIDTAPTPNAVPVTEAPPRFGGRFLTAADPGWDAARQAFNLRVDARPAAIAMPRDVADVVAAVEYAAARGLRVAPQATGLLMALWVLSS